MAEDAGTTSKPPLPPLLPPLTEPPSRTQSKKIHRVTFSELPPKHHAITIDDIKERYNERLEQEYGWNGWCCTCVVCILAIVAFLLIIGAIFFAILQGCLPRVDVQSIHFTKFDTASSETNFDAEVNITIQFSNKNDISEISYDTLTTYVYLGDFQFHDTEFGGFSQRVKNVTSINISTRVKEDGHNQDVTEKLVKDFDNSKEALHVYIKGTIDFKIGATIKFGGIPFSAKCDPKKDEVETGMKPKCSTRIFLV